MTERAEPTYLVCPTPSWIGHTPKQNVRMTSLQMMREVRAGRVVYEALGYDPVRPYADFEKEFKTMEEMHANRDAELKRCIAELVELNGPLKNIVVLDSCGKKGDNFILSWHFIPVGLGAYASPADVKRAGIIPFRKDEPKVWDQGVFPEFGSQRLMRTFGASKQGENRPFLMLIDGKLTSLEDLYKISEEVALIYFEMALIQNVEGETMIGTEVKQEPAVETGVTEKGQVPLGKFNGIPLGEDIKITSVAQIEQLCRIAGWFEEVDRDTQTYCNEVWLIRNSADILGLDIEEARALAQKISAVCPNNDPVHVDKTFNQTADRDPEKKRRLLGQLRKQAKEKNEVAYENWMKPLIVARNETDPLMAELDKLDWKNDDIAKFRGAITKAAVHWVDLVRKAETTESELLRHTSERIERMKQAHLPINRRLVLSDKRFLHNKHIKGDELLKEFTQDTIIAVINGGETIWVTADYVESQQTTYIKELDRCPLSAKSEVIRVYCVNMCWIKDIDQHIRSSTDSDATLAYITNSMVTKKCIHGYAQEYRKTHFAQIAGYFPYLSDAQKPKSDEIYNKFAGFRYQYEERKTKYKFGDYPKEIEPFIRHVYDIMANGNQHIGNYLLVWFAFLLQFPARKPEMALFFISIEGAGKGIIFESFAKYVMGEDHFLALRKIDDLINHFNAHLEGKRLVTVAETKEGDLANKETHRALKNAITDERTVFTKKGKDAHTAMSYNAIVMFGNNSSAISIDAGDRRLCPIQMSNAMIGNMEYFNALSKAMEQNGYKIFDFLANLDLTGYDVRHPTMAHGQRVEENQFRVRLVEDSLTEPLNFMVAIARHETKHLFIGAEPLDVREGTEEALRCQQSELYKAYSEWYILKHHGDTKYLCKQKTFIPEIERLGLKNEKRRWKDSEGQTQRSWCYSFTFTELRNAFRSLLKNPSYDF